MEIQELCRKLKPIIGKRADKYLLAYLSEDEKGRRELMIALQLLAAQALGNDVEHPDVHLSSPPKHVAEGLYPLGDIIYANREQHPCGLREDEFIQHTAIFGRSGAGKTNTVVQIINGLLDNKKPFLIFDWKRNYRDLLAVRKEEIAVYTVGRAPVPFIFNPLIPPKGTDASVWLKKLIEIIAHSYYLGEGVMFLFQEAIHAVYEAFGVYKGTPAQYPTFNDVLQWLQNHPVKGRKALWMDSAMRGMKSICFGHMGHVVNTGVQPHLEALLKDNAILELDGLANADKTLIVESLLLWIHHYRLTQPDRETFKHAIIIEEAHHILRKQAAGGAEAITETILREIRELGEGIILVDQHPSMISIPALGNTYTTITMNLKHRSDVNAIAAAMLMNDEEREILGRLAIGEAVVKLQGRWPRPFRVKVPLCALPKGSISDSELIQRMTALNRIVPNLCTGASETTVKTTEMLPPTELEQAILRDVAEQPFSGVVERYKRIGASRRKGNAAKAACIQRGWLQPVDIPTRNGRMVLLELAEDGRQEARKQGITNRDTSRWGGLEHEYWKHQISTRLKELGMKVQEEVSGNGFTDIIVSKNTQSIAIEVETGKSDWKGNIQKNLDNGYQQIILAVTNEEALNKIQSTLTQNSMEVIVKAAWGLTEINNSEEIFR